jgi:hypothetical protein
MIERERTELSRNFIYPSFVITSKENTMKKAATLFLLLTVLILNACTSLTVGNSIPPAPVETATSMETQIPTPVSPTDGLSPAIQKLYKNNLFGLSFEFPSNWFGPSEYVSGETLRVEVGSDKVYPYGEPPEQPSDVKNSYNVVIQYTKNNQNSFWKDTYQPLLNMKDGESLSGTKSLIIRVRQIDLGRFTGFEYIFTLPETAQTEHVYGREVMLLDAQTNDLLTITGQPNNVEVGNGVNWRDVYRAVDEANTAFFHGIVESITIK